MWSSIKAPIFKIRRFSKIAVAEDVHGKKYREFMPWLVSRNQDGDLSALHIGFSGQCGRGLFARHPIRAGDRMLEISSNLMITPSDLPPEVNASLQTNVNDWTKLALVILIEQQKAQASFWAPYLSFLPLPGQLHNTFLWTEAELKYLEYTHLYNKTLQRLEMIAQEYSSAKNAIRLRPELFGDQVSFEDFKHVYATVVSRALAIGTEHTLALIPMMDFMNHNNSSRTLLSYDGVVDYAVVKADKDYADGDEVWISYGDLSNADFALDYGFTIPNNPFNEAELLTHFDKMDPLYEAKLKLVRTRGTNALIIKKGKEEMFSSVVSMLCIQDPSMTKETAKAMLRYNLLHQFARLKELPPMSSEQFQRKEIAASVLDGELSLLAEFINKI